LADLLDFLSEFLDILGVIQRVILRLAGRRQTGKAEFGVLFFLLFLALALRLQDVAHQLA
jgi:hypothetical protein